MIEWGVTFGSHDAAIAVFKNNELVFATDAERFSRKKNDHIISDKLISYCEEQWGIPHKVYYYENPHLKATRRLFAGQRPIYQKRTFKYPLHYSFHHHSHASYAGFTCPFNESTILVLDAIGEWDTMSLWKYKDNKLRRKFKRWWYPKSLGLFYSAMTRASGWKANEEEYIMMGAAAVNKKINPKLNDFLFKLWETNTNFHTGINLDSYDKYEIAHSSQNVFEEVLLQLTKDIKDNLCIVGGCALNVSAMRHLSIPNVYIPPNPGDAGSAIGCVLSRNKTKQNLSPFLGYEIKGKYPIDDIIRELKENKIVGVANGKAEFGPRALGNRSILADPREINIKDKLNDIKGRENFRPFGAMILSEDVDKYYYDLKIDSPYMNCTYNALPKTCEDYPGLIHLDNTTRLQTIKEEFHLRNLLEVWKKETGCPMLINTSLNVKGEPIVNDEKDVQLFKSKVSLSVY